MKATYYNRDGDTIIFEKTNNKTVTMSGFRYYRVGSAKDNINFIDPAGGPFIQIGADVGRYFEGQPKMIVSSIVNDGPKTLLMITEQQTIK